MKSGLVPKVRQQGCGSRSFPNLGKLPVFFCQSDEAGKLESFPLMQLQALNVQWAMNTREICGFVDDIYDIVKEKVEICGFFWFKYKCRITQHIIQTILLVGSGLGMNTTEKWKAISVSGTIHKIFCSTLTIVQSKQKIISNNFFLKLKLHIFLLEVCLKMKNQRKNTTGSVSNAVYADGLCQHCFDFRNYFFCF